MDSTGEADVTENGGHLKSAETDTNILNAGKQIAYT
jgi:hypothetical protein